MVAFSCKSRPVWKVGLCTGWRKKNACFSNNCNFVYFQYKKIILTPKQPEINAVLITYIYYSIMENYRVAQKELMFFK